MLSVTLGNLYSQCLIKTDSYRLICADEVRYADSISSGTRLYISSRNAYVTSPRSVFNLVEGYGQYFIKVTNNANNQKVAIGRQWINRIDSTSGNKALIYIKDINVTFTTTESYSAVVDSAISCFQRAVSSGLATLSDGDYGDVIVSGSGLVMTVDKPDLGLHNLADGDFSVVADSTALSLTNTRRIELTTKNIDGWISRYLQNNTSLTLRTASTTKTSRIYVDTTGANFQFVNGANNASLRIGDSVAVRFNTSGSVGQVLTVTSVDGDGRLVINPKTGGSGTANCEQTLTKNSHGFRKWTPIYWNGSAWARPTFDSIIPTYIVVDSTTANTFKVSNCGNYSSTLTEGLYYYTGTSPGYTLTQPTIKTPLFEVAQSRLILQPFIGFQLTGGSGGVTSSVLADTAAAIRADFPIPDGNGIISALPLGNVTINNAQTLNIVNGTNSYSFQGYATIWQNTGGGKYFQLKGTNASGWNAGFGVSGSGGYSFDREVHAASTGYNARFFDITYLPWNGYAVSHDAMNITTEGEVVHAYGDPFGVWGGRTEFYATTSYASSKRSFLFKNVTSYHANKILVDFQNAGGTIAALKQDGKFYVGNDSSFVHDPVVDTTLFKGKVAIRNSSNYYSFAITSPSATSGAISNHIWTAGAPSFLRSQHGVATGTTDGSGDLTVTFAAAMPDATYSMQVTLEGTTAMEYTIHTKTTSTCKVRFYGSTTGLALTATGVTVSYESKDY